MKRLFIGGVADGQWRNIADDRAPHVVAKPHDWSKREVVKDSDALTKEKIGQTEYYEPVLLEDGAERRRKLYTVFVRPRDRERVVELLIEGYKPYMARKK